MRDITPDTWVCLLDFRGRIIFASRDGYRTVLGAVAWDRVDPRSQDPCRAAYAAAVAGETVRLIVWSGGEPYWCEYRHVDASEDVAVCITFRRLSYRWWALSNRERELATLYGQGLSSAEAAAAMGVSVATVHTLRRRLRGKAGGLSESQLVIWCHHHLPAAPLMGNA